jgi:hypothetical protein
VAEDAAPWEDDSQESEASAPAAATPTSSDNGSRASDIIAMIRKRQQQ